MNSSQREHSEQNRASGRKPYMQPQLQIYGDLQGITQSVSMTGQVNDHPTSGMNDKTA
jgi:hypothetical protein